MHCSAAVLALLLAAAPSVRAQAPASDSMATLTPGLVRPGLWERAQRATIDSVPEVQAEYPTEVQVWGRVGAGMLGGAIGGLGLGFLAYAYLPPDHCNCDDPGLNKAVVSAAVGAVAGAALAAALPRQQSTCSYGRRVLFGLIGATAGGALGAIARKDQAVVLLVPIGAGIGAGISSAHC